MPATYEAIATQTVTSSTANIDFTSIPQTYTDLIVVVNGINAQLSNVYFRVGNGSIDTGSNYSRTALVGDGSTATSHRFSNQSNGNLTYMGYMDTTYNSSQIAHFMNYSNTTTNKTILSRANNTAYATDALVNLWRSTSAINVIRLYGDNNFTGGTFTLYGVKSA